MLSVSDLGMGRTLPLVAKDHAAVANRIREIVSPVAEKTVRSQIVQIEEMVIPLMVQIRPYLIYCPSHLELIGARGIYYIITKSKRRYILNFVHVFQVVSGSHVKHVLE